MKNSEKISFTDILKFLIPSIFGVLLLMIPFNIGGKSTVIVSRISSFLQGTFSLLAPVYVFVLVAITISLVMTIIYKVAKPKFIENSNLLKGLADIPIFWFVIRVIGFLLAFAVAFGERLSLPEIIWSGNTGGLILFDLIGGLFTIFLVAGFVLPLLTEFGLLEFIGVFLTPIMRPVFKLPGRSAVDCIASWVGDGTIGVTLTNKQYEDGYYSSREAAVISTTFSAVSITFCLVVIENVGLTDYFGHFYLTIALVGIACALIIPRIPPLSMKPETYFPGEKTDMGESIPAGYSKMNWGVKLAVEKAHKNLNVTKFFGSGVKTVLGLWLGVLPSIMAIGTIVLIISETTPLFQWLGIPFAPILKLLQVPLADEAAPTMIIGFADMVVPSIIAADFTNQMTQFIVATISVTQLIYMSETGAVILGSNLPVNFLELFILFIERTLISIPIIVLMAHLFF